MHDLDAALRRTIESRLVTYEPMVTQSLDEIMKICILVVDVSDRRVFLGDRLQDAMLAKNGRSPEGIRLESMMQRSHGENTNYSYYERLMSQDIGPGRARLTGGRV